ncbi:monocarboxylate transporter 14 [Trichonephila inaurata madagascariensis]|uniref:Monocarboxylate transporter 14 n=1 Tax=Trichonephila inaurata madagascariensis TaxID=2747483 RepID=A0A8X6XQC8_9ARAC|nr:monocarboxylate transporter 14 [Trichonephila inaurata madagascariensis]
MENKEAPKSEEEGDTTVAVPRPPDGGWGWMVVLGSFMCNVIVDGIIFSYGLFLPELSKDLNASKGKLAWVGSLLAGFYLIAGPIVSGLANTYGTRPVTIVGTVVSAISFAVASFSPNVEYLCLAFGVCGGIGFGFIYLPAVVTVGFYFDRRRAFATGLAVCGSGVGTFIMAPLVQYLLVTFDWRGTMLILAGIVLNCAFFGALFRPIKTTVPKKIDEDIPKEVKPPVLKRIRELREPQRERWDSASSLPAIPHASVSLPEISCMGKKLDSNPLISSDNNSPPPSYSDVVEADEEERYAFLQTPPPPAVQNSTLSVSQPAAKPKRSRYVLRAEMSRPFYRQDVLYSASLLHLPEFKKSNNDLSLYAASVTKIPQEPIPETSGCLSPAMKDTFRQMLDISLLKSPTFLLLGAGGFLTLAGFFVPFMFVVDRAVQQGITLEEATYILPVIGLTNTIGRVFCGWISDRPNLNALTINNGALIIGGLATALSTCVNTISFLLAYGALFGFCIGCFATLRSIVIVELLGLEKLTNAFGLLLLFQGIASIIGAPVAGMFYDVTGSYDAPFYIAGTLIFLSGLLGIPLPYISSWEKNKKANIIINIEAPEEDNTFVEPVPVSQLRRFSYDVILEEPWCTSPDKTCVYKTRLYPKLHKPMLLSPFDDL